MMNMCGVKTLISSARKHPNCLMDNTEVTKGLAAIQTLRGNFAMLTTVGSMRQTC